MHIKPSSAHKKEKVEKDKLTIDITLPEHVTMKDVMLQYTDNSYRIKYARGYENEKDGGWYACAVSGCIEGTLPFKIKEPVCVAKDGGFSLVFKRGSDIANQLKNVRIIELCADKKDKEAICGTCGQGKEDDEMKSGEKGSKVSGMKKGEESVTKDEKKGKVCAGEVCKDEKEKVCKDEVCKDEKGKVCDAKGKVCKDEKECKNKECKDEECKNCCDKNKKEEIKKKE